MFGFEKKESKDVKKQKDAKSANRPIIIYTDRF